MFMERKHAWLVFGRDGVERLHVDFVKETILPLEHHLYIAH